MKKVFKKMKKRLSGDGDRKVDRALSKSDRSRSSDTSQPRQQPLDGSSANNSERIKEAPKSSSPIINPKDTITKEDIASSAPSSNVKNQAQAPTGEKKEDTEKTNQYSSSGDKTGVDKKDSSGEADGLKDKGDKPIDDDTSGAFETYSEVPALESIKLPRGGISIETKAVGRIQVGDLLLTVVLRFANVLHLQYLSPMQLRPLVYLFLCLPSMFHSVFVGYYY